MANNSTIPTESEAAMLANLPVAGQLNYFFNTNKGGNIWSIDSTGAFSFVASVDNDCCACEISSTWLCALNDALLSGAMTAAQYQSALAVGVTVNSINNGGGNCSISIGTIAAPVTSVTMTGAITSTLTMAHTGTAQAGVVLAPSNAYPGVIWVTSDPTKATVNQSGLITGVAAGTVIITVYSIEDPTKLSAITITVT